jgi:IS5 family transposase
LRLTGALPDETTILNFRRLLETHELAGQVLSVVNGDLEEIDETESRRQS